ncbi:MAG TPA: hypothetical protein VIR03_04145 [Candidatus Saccharimonadales bacterium]
MESMVRRPKRNRKAGVGALAESDDPWRDFCALVFDEYLGTRLDSAKPDEVHAVHDELIELDRSLKAHMRLVLREENAYIEQ